MRRLTNVHQTAKMHSFIFSVIAWHSRCLHMERTWKPDLARTARCDYFMGRCMMSTGLRMYA